MVFLHLWGNPNSNWKYGKFQIKSEFSAFLLPLQALFPTCSLVKSSYQQNLRIYQTCFSHSSRFDYLLNCEGRITLGSLLLRITAFWSLPVMHDSKVLLSFTADVCISKQCAWLKFIDIKGQKVQRVLDCYILIEELHTEFWKKKHAHLENHLMDWYLNGLCLTAGAAIHLPYLSALQFNREKCKNGYYYTFN